MGGLARRFLPILLWLLWPLAATYGAPLEESGRVARVVDGDALVLADGRQVRLVGIDAPRAPLGTAKDIIWRQAEAAKAMLVELAQDRIVTLRYGGAPGDRYGRVLAQLHRDDGLWLQGEMLRRGLARVHSYADNRALVGEMLAVEDEARGARRGLWRDPAYAVRRAEEMERFVETFQLVEGTIVDVAKVKGQIFLNFAPDWHSAFTARLPRSALPLFREAGLDPLALKGATVRLRGWVRFEARPLIDITHPEQIELLDRP
ncbi:MAG TPA: thermonuclease family protein [Stellaceae bacterium]|nr:thermonuclease family protein [Stellaceae bacterium]